MKKFIRSHWRSCIIFIVVVLLLLAVTGLFGINHATGLRDALTNEPILSNVYYTTQLITSAAIIIGGIIGIWQYTLTSKAERIKMDVERVQKAINLAEYYKDNILSKYAIIQFVFTDSGLMDIIHNIDKEKFQVFDEVELKNLWEISCQKH